MKTEYTLEKSIEWKLSQKLIAAVKEYIQGISYADYVPVSQTMLQAAISVSNNIAMAVGSVKEIDEVSEWSKARGELFVVRSLVASASLLGYPNAPNIIIEVDILSDKLLAKVLANQNIEEIA